MYGLKAVPFKQSEFFRSLFSRGFSEPATGKSFLPGDLRPAWTHLPKGTARVGVELETDDAPELLCFAGELGQVFVNLIANAVESMESGGQITIRVRPGTDWQTGDRGVRISIADTGSGLSLETRKHMYDAFYTTKGSGGSGLGLWVTARIVRKHRGHIHVRSRRAAQCVGTAFILVFPYAGAEGKTAGPHEHAA